MSENIKGTDVFTGYEFVPCHESEACESCPFSQYCSGKDLTYKTFCHVLVGKRYGNWVSLLVEPAPTTPTVPGWYWVRRKHRKDIVRLMTEGDIEYQCFSDQGSMIVEHFIDCQFAPCTGRPEWWER